MVSERDQSEVDPRERGPGGEGVRLAAAARDQLEQQADRLLRQAAASTVLVVDDDEGIRVAVAEILEFLGYRVATASDGVEASELLRLGLEPNAIVLDMMMPRMDGWTFLGKLRADPRWENIPVVVASAMIGSPPQGADALLQKPFDVSDLHREVARFCAH